MVFFFFARTGYYIFLTRLFLSTSNLILFIFFSVRFVLRVRTRRTPCAFRNYADDRCGFRVHVLINVGELVIIDRFSFPDEARPAATTVALPPHHRGHY